MWDLLFAFFIGAMAVFGAGAFWASHGIGKKLKELKALETKRRKGSKRG